MGLRAWFENLVDSAAVAVPIEESLPGLEYDDPDLNLPGTQSAYQWRRITQAAADLPSLKQDQMQNLALYLSDRNPLARGILDLIVSFIVGEGFTVRSKEDDVQKAIDRFWDDAQNDMDSRVEDMTRELSIYGEQLALAFVNETSGRVALVSVDPRQIRAVAPHPAATDRPYAVGIAPDVSTSSEYRWVKIIAEDENPTSPTFGMLVGADPGEKMKAKGAPATPFFEPTPDETTPDTTRLVGCFFWAINKPRSALRGRSDLLAVADNVDMLDQFLFDEGQRMSFQRVFAWWRKITGADETTIKRKAAESTAPKPGGVLVTNESEEWSVLAPKLNTEDSQNYADLQLSSIATAVGIPKTWLNGIMDVNRATAQSMDAPGLKRMSRRQRYVRRMIERMVRFALDQAEIAGTLKPADDGRHPFTVSTPEMSAQDMETAGRSLMMTTQAMGMASAAGWIDDQTAQEITALMMSQLGADVDIADIQARIQAQKQAADDEAANTIPDYFGVGNVAGPDRLGKAMAAHGGASTNGTSHGTNGTSTNGTSHGADVVVPVVSPAAKDVAGIISQVSKALVDLGNAGVIDGEFAQDVVAKLFATLGVDVDVAAMQDRLAQAKADAVPTPQPPALAGQSPAGGSSGRTTLPPVGDLLNLDDMALEAIRELGAELIWSDPIFYPLDSDPLTRGMAAVLEAFDAALHPRAAGGRFGPKADQPAPTTPDAPASDSHASDSPPSQSDDEIKAQVADLLSQLKARDAAKPKPPAKPPVHPSMKQAELSSAISSLKPDDAITLTLTNGLEVAGKVTLTQGGSAVIQTADGKYAILHDHLRGVASVETPSGTTSAAPAAPRAPRAPRTTGAAKPPTDRSAAAKKSAATRAANKAAAAAATT